MLLDMMFSTEPIIEVQNLIGADLEWLGHGMALFGDSRLVLVLAVMMFWFMSRHRPYQVLAASLVGAALGSGLKLFFDVGRPAGPDLLLSTTTTSPAFPSGHVMLATCFWGALAWYGFIPKWLSAAIIGMVMFARVYLGAHFIGDVVFGALIGFAWLVVFHRWIGPLLERANPRTVSTVVALAMAGSFAILPITSAFPFGWEIVGGLVGAGVGLILQERKVGFDPVAVAGHWQLAKAGIGVFGILLVIGIDFVLPFEIMIVELAMYFMAAIWGLLLAPILFQRLGLGTDKADREPVPAS